MSQGNVNLGVLQETEFVGGGEVSCESRKYCVMETLALVLHSGGVAVFYLEAEHSYFEVRCLHGLDIVRFHLVMGRQQWHIAEFYIDPNKTLTIEDAVAAIGKRL